MESALHTHCLFCSVGCPIKIVNQRSERFQVDYGRKKQNSSALGLCGRGTSFVDLLQHPKRLRNGLKRSNGRMIDLELPAARAEFEQLLEDAQSKGPVALLADGNLTCEDLLAIHQWSKSRQNPVNMAIYLPLPDLQLLEGISSTGVASLTREDLISCDAVLIVGDVFTTHPVLSQLLLDSKFKKPPTLFITLDTRRSVTNRFGSPALKIVSEGHQAMLELLLRAVNLPAGSDEKSIQEQLIESGEISDAVAERLMKQLKSIKRLGIVIAPELTLNSDWRSVACRAMDLARAKGGGVLPLYSYGNAVGAYRIMKNCGIPPFESLLKPSKSTSWSAFIQIACDLRDTYPEQMLQPLFNVSTRQILFSSMKTPGILQSDLALAIPLPVEYEGTVLSGFGQAKELPSTEFGPQGTLRIREFFSSSTGGDSSKPWKEIPLQAERIPIDLSDLKSKERSGARLFAVASPIHFEDGTLTRQAGWTRYFQAELQARIGTGVAKELKVRSGQEIEIRSNGNSLTLSCSVDPSVSPDGIEVPLHFPKVRRFLPWRIEGPGHQLVCPEFRVELKVISESKATE